jgi:hypothetical protein
VSGAFWRKTDETKTKVIAQNIIKNIYEKNEVAAGEVTGVSHLSKTLKGAGSIVVGTIPSWNSATCWSNRDHMLRSGHPACTTMAMAYCPLVHYYAQKSDKRALVRDVDVAWSFQGKL